MRRIVCLLSAAVLLFTLAACGENPASVSVPAESTPMMESAPAAVLTEEEERELIGTCLTRLFDCASLPEETRITEAWIDEKFPECTETARQKSIYQRGIGEMALYPNAIPGTACRYAPVEITVEPDGEHLYSYCVELEVTGSGYKEAAVTGRVQMTEDGLISSISFQEVTSGGEPLPGGFVELYRTPEA